MEHLSFQPADVPATVQIARFRGRGGVTEVQLLLRPTAPGPPATQLAWIEQAYRAALAWSGLASGTALWRRVFAADLAAQTSQLADHPVTSRTRPDEPCAVSWVEQAPEPPATLALWAYHVQDPAGPFDKRREGDTLAWTRNGLAHCWTTGLAAPAAPNAYDQTRAAFERYDDVLRGHGMTLARHVLRTWLFVRDIDAHYAELVRARREHFERHGLTPQTHYIASTGIGGGGPDPAALVTLDALAIAGIRPAQVHYLAAPTHLCPTYTYGVTFERGTAVRYADRTHVLISGTASIDARGEVLHPGDVTRQVDRAVENIAALLATAGATLGDLGVLLAYVREPEHRGVVRRRLRERCGPAPIEVVVGRVCRPTWLVEIEGVAVLDAERPDLPAF